MRKLHAARLVIWMALAVSATCLGVAFVTGDRHQSFGIVQFAVGAVAAVNALAAWLDFKACKK